MALRNSDDMKMRSKISMRVYLDNEPSIPQFNSLPGSDCLSHPADKNFFLSKLFLERLADSSGSCVPNRSERYLFFLEATSLRTILTRVHYSTL